MNITINTKYLQPVSLFLNGYNDGVQLEIDNWIECEADYIADTLGFTGELPEMRKQSQEIFNVDYLELINEVKIEDRDKLYLSLWKQATKNLIELFNNEYNTEYEVLETLDPYFPSEYNFKIAHCDIAMSVDIKPLDLILEQELLADYKVWLKREYSSRDGFYSFVPTDYLELDKDEVRKHSVPLEFLISRLEYKDYEIFDEFHEEISNSLVTPKELDVIYDYINSKD